MIIDKKSVVKIEYDLRIADDMETIIDSNIGQEPLEFLTDKGYIIPGLEKELMGLKAGDKKEVKVAPSEGYGEIDENAIATYPKEQFAGLDLKVGMVLQGASEDGQTVQVIVKEILDDSVVVDGNHFLAGKELLFNVSVVDVREATSEELASGQLASCGSSCCSGENHSQENEYCGGGCH